MPDRPSDASSSPGREGAPAGKYAPGDDPSDPDAHRHGDVTHSHPHRGPHEHGDDYEYDEAHDPDMPRP